MHDYFQYDNNIYTFLKSNLRVEKCSIDERCMLKIDERIVVSSWTSCKILTNQQDDWSISMYRAPEIDEH